MAPDLRKLKRARLIERIRTVERGRSALAASEAEQTRRHLFGVAERTRSLARHYALQEGELVGADLRSGKAMRDQLQQLTVLSERHASDAERRSDVSLEDLAGAERRLKQAEEDRRDLVRVIVNSMAER